ncbi:AmmeMemoRadiSam system radical SAM enzyme, partial [bacterium]|nr:AmmeMemoRadiSam system radical SAM enzyme [bacterium]
KKPLFHFQPGSTSFSVATVGCNFRCAHCQNADISILPIGRGHILGQDLTPEEIVAAAEENGCRSIAYTYTEPTVFFEYAHDTARLAAEKDIGNIFVTNGYMTEEALRTIQPCLNAANVDLKSFSEDHYRQICGASLQPVLESLQLMKSLGIWLEVTTLVIPTLNDSEEELRRIAEFIFSLGPETPWHVSQFYPTFQLTHLPPTPVESIRRGREIGLDVGLRYVYTGNIPGDEGENTFCYCCGRRLIHRHGYSILENRLQEGHCDRCGAIIDGVDL